MKMAHAKRSFIVFGCAALFSLLAFSCSRSDLRSDNYWNGSEKESAWVSLSVGAGSSHRGFVNDGALFGAASRVGKASSLDDTRPAERDSEAIPEPRKGSSGKFRIAVVVSGEYWEFFENLKGLVQGFANIGWAEPVAIPASVVTSEQLVRWLSTQKYSEWIEFVPELYCNLAWGDNEEQAEALFGKRKPAADVIVAYGGMASKFFYRYDSYPVPVVADAVTDPFGAGITKNAEDSGKDFFSCKIDAEQFKQQVRLFHEIAGFKKLGIVYGDDEYGQIYGAVRDVESVASELGFEIVRNTRVKEEMAEDTVPLYLEALADVAARSDAVYIGASTAVTEYDILDDIVAILDAAKVPSFALEGSIRVKDGVMLSLASSGTIRSGIYTATKISQIFTGRKPRELSQKFESVPSVAVNLATAAKIGFEVPADVIVNSDEVYLTRDGSPAVQSRRIAGGDASLTDFAAAASQEGALIEPQKRADGKPWQVGVVISGSYWEFDRHFLGMLEGFAELGWVNPETLARISKPVSGVEPSVESVLARIGADFSEYIEFPEKYRINLQWGDKLSAGAPLFGKAEPDLDLILVFGGVAGKLFAQRKDYPVPVLMEGITDPVGSGIIYSIEDSGKDYATCRVDPGQYQRQVQLFHDFIGFRRLGIIYGDDEYGRLYGAVHDVELVARKRGFAIVRKTAVRERVSRETVPMYLAALRDICDEVDAVYLGASTALTEYNIARDVAEILREAKIPSFALEGEIRVKEGIMLGVSSLESEKFGLYNAKKAVAIFGGASPRVLPQIMEGVPSIALNMKTARLIDRDIPLSVLSSVDKIFY